ncbi:RtcB family protein [Rhodovarius crocodyli]|uniref:3'-phosphate/5'-hydroxy nucleic acid ligase n=1 Tax=Rhodovarius crocodyli TaxID=1979269 RepID=A0A437MF70_9PROT|nr:RtcB family protein [Rhodovarius crocodyli]RVT96272.1 RtcB family protein [Rhodovarius crocodyli]
MSDPIIRRPDAFEARARELAIAAGLEPDARVPHETKEGRSMPAWCTFRATARAEVVAAAAQEARGVSGQDERYASAPLLVCGDHEQGTIEQMRTCMSVGNVLAGALCADGHLGYAQPVGGVIAYEGQISISGVGYDIGCGNMAVRLDTRYSDIAERRAEILGDIVKAVSFGVGRTNAERVQHPVLDNDDHWRAADVERFRTKAAEQLGTVGSGNHYVDLFRDELGFVWIGVHFGSRGLGHTSATKYLKAAGGQDGMFVPPAVVDENSELGQRYLAAMHLAGEYAYAGREWVVDRVRRIIGAVVTKVVHNHHNFAWKEIHHGREMWVVRKGATPAWPGQEGFVGGSMGDNAVIIEGVDGPASQAALRSTIHGAGRVHGRREAHRRFTREQMLDWLRERDVLVHGGDVDESPMAYRRLPEVLAHHTGSIRVTHQLTPFAVAMAGRGDSDPYKD